MGYPLDSLNSTPPGIPAGWPGIENLPLRPLPAFWVKADFRSVPDILSRHKRRSFPRGPSRDFTEFRVVSPPARHGNNDTGPGAPVPPSARRAGADTEPGPFSFRTRLQQKRAELRHRDSPEPAATACGLASHPDINGLIQCSKIQLKQLGSDVSPEVRQGLQRTVETLEAQVAVEQAAIDQYLEAGRQYSRERNNLAVLKENQAHWRESAFNSLVRTAGGRIEEVSAAPVAQYSPSRTTAGEAVFEVVVKQNAIKYGAGKVESNGLRLVDGAIRDGDVLFREPISVDTDIGASANVFAGIEHLVGVAQGIWKARDAALGRAAAEKAETDFKAARDDFTHAVEKLKNITRDMQRKALCLQALETLNDLERYLLGKPSNINRDSLLGALTSSLLSPALSCGAKRTLAQYRSLLGRDAIDSATLGAAKEALLQTIRTTRNEPVHNQQLLRESLAVAGQTLMSECKAEADGAYGRLMLLVARYGQNAQQAAALAAEYKRKMNIATLKVLRYGDALGVDILRVSRLLVDSYANPGAAVGSVLGVAVNAVGGATSALALGLTLYDLRKEGMGAYENHQTWKKADLLQRHFAEKGDTELSDIAGTLKRRQSKFRNTKIGHILLNGLQALGYFAGSVYGGAALAVIGSAGSLIAATTLVAFAGPIAWFFALLGSVSLLGYSSYRLIDWRVHHLRSQHLKKVIAGNDESAIGKYREKNKLQGCTDREIQAHAIGALTEHSVKFALHRLYQRFCLEVEHLDKAYWSETPTFQFLNVVLEAPDQVQALAQIEGKLAIKLLAGKLQIRGG